jgi:thiamine-phosphate pyrophosphorylase
MELDLRLLAIADLAVIARDRLVASVAAAARGGATLVQLRGKNVPAGELLSAAEEILPVIEGAGAALFVNDRVDVALLAGASGVHLGDEDLDPRSARMLLGPGSMIGCTARTPEAALAAIAAGADYLGVGSVFGGGTKSGVPIIGLDGLARVAAASTKPIVAIGGIDVERAADCVAAGAEGVAVIGALFGGDPSSEEIEDRAARLRHAVAVGCHRRGGRR